MHVKNYTIVSFQFSVHFEKKNPLENNVSSAWIVGKIKTKLWTNGHLFAQMVA